MYITYTHLEQPLSLLKMPPETSDRHRSPCVSRLARLQATLARLQETLALLQENQERLKPSLLWSHQVSLELGSTTNPYRFGMCKAGLEPMEDSPISSLGFSIRLGVSDRGESVLNMKLS